MDSRLLHSASDLVALAGHRRAGGFDADMADLS